MVEFDIVLTKDKIPVVYHDFTICIQNPYNPNKYLDVSINQLTYNEIKQTKVYSHKILKQYNKEGDENKIINVDKYTSIDMFPTLKEMCLGLNENLGFNIEIKYPQDLEDNTNEINDNIKWLNRNDYVDSILNYLFNMCKLDNNRSILFSTFDPTICSM